MKWSVTTSIHPIILHTYLLQTLEPRWRAKSFFVYDLLLFWTHSTCSEDVCPIKRVCTQYPRDPSSNRSWRSGQQLWSRVTKRAPASSLGFGQEVGMHRISRVGSGEAAGRGYPGSPSSGSRPVHELGHASFESGRGRSVCFIAVEESFVGNDIVVG